MTLVRYPHSIEAIFNTDFGGNGVTFDGSTNYIVYNIPNALLAQPKLTFVMEFYPDFEVSDNVNIYFFDTTNGAEYSLLKANNASNNVFYLLIGNVAIASIPSATYSPYWNVGERNVLVISSESASTNAWLNGNQILVNDNSAWSPKYPTELYIGCEQGTGMKFDGRIKHFSIHNRLFTADEALALYNNSLFNFENKSSLYHVFDSVVDSVVEDKSGYGYDTTTDGCTFLDPGISFDGTDDRLIPTISDPTGNFTVAYKDKNLGVSFDNDLTTWNLLKLSGGYEGTLDYLAVFPFILTPIQEDFLSMRWKASVPF